MVGIAVNAVVILVAAFIGAFATAHSTTIIKILGGKPATTPSRTPVPSISPHGPINILPPGPSFTRARATINFDGLDLDRNPPENGNVTTGNIDISQNGGAAPSLLFGNSLEVVQWKKHRVPSQAQCHDDEITNGDPNFSFDLTSAQQTGANVSFCILTSEGRDAYLVVRGTQLVSNQPIPAQVFVWSRIIPVS